MYTYVYVYVLKLHLLFQVALAWGSAIAITSAYVWHAASAVANEPKQCLPYSGGNLVPVTARALFPDPYPVCETLLTCMHPPGTVRRSMCRARYGIQHSAAAAY